jgi:ribonuclease PH
MTDLVTCPDERRPVRLALDYVNYPEGSVLIELGCTRVLCNARLVRHQREALG